MIGPRPLALLPLRAGPLALEFDEAGTAIRYLRVGDCELIRGIYGAVRDRNWDTVHPAISGLEVDATADEFRVSFAARCIGADLDFAWRGEITGGIDGTVTFVFDGQAEQPSVRNRIGLCVLHPIRECAGHSVRVAHVDGRVTSGVFPAAIAPHQPFTDIRAIQHTGAPGLLVDVTFEGETFEMEDQRNWTDASYKTYSTPLALPFPVRLEVGARVRHRVTVRLTASRSAGLVGGRSLTAPRLALDWSVPRPRPPVGLGMATGTLDIEPVAQGRLAAVAPAHLRVDLALHGPAWPADLDRAARLAASLGAGLEVAVFLSDDAARELAALRAHREARPCVVHRWLVFHAAEKSTSERWVQIAHQTLHDHAPSAALAAGTNAHFAELNRQRPAAGTPALPCYSMTPQVHAFDDASLIETLEAQRSTVESAWGFCGKPVVISPITLLPRFNPNAADDGALNGPTVPDADPRQPTTFAAAWTAGTLARLLACPHVHSLTFYETHGPRGIVSADGDAYPMAFVFEALRDWPLVGNASSSDPLSVDALALTSPSGSRCVLLAGLGTQIRRMRVEGLDGVVRYRTLTPQGFSRMTQLHATQGHVDVRVPAEGVALLETGEPYVAGDDAAEDR
jgi:D-apionolactonase